MERVASPCIRQCCLDCETDVCLGCFRSLDEITAWHDADDREREEILARCRARRAMHLARFPGIRAD